MIAVPIVAKDVASALSDMKEAVVRRADVVEIRLDYMPVLSESDLSRLVGFKGIRKIVTLRRKKDNGHFRGSESERIRTLSLACRLGADYVDVESDADVSRLELAGAKLIVSWHDFSGTPSLDELRDVYRECAAKGADIVKVVTMANDYNDNVRIFEFIESVSEGGSGFVSRSGAAGGVIAFCMGEKGKLSRIFCRKFGSVLTFAALSPEKVSAPGQVDIDVIRGWDEVIL